MFKEEIGDLLFLVLSIIHAAESRGIFSYKDVVNETVHKYISRHPHVFASKRKMTPAQILIQWEKQKAKKSRAHPIDRVPSYLPALYQAKQLYDKAERLGILRPKKPQRGLSRKEIGRQILAMAEKSVRSHVDPETALRRELRNLRKVLKKSKRT